MLDYIQKTLNINCSPVNISLQNIILPLYFDLYELIPVKMDEIQVLFMKPRENLLDISSIKKHMQKLQSVTGFFSVLYLDVITYSRKKSFLENHIPFVVENNQIYLPFMAVCLQEKLKSKNEKKESFTPSAQLLFLYFFYQNNKELPVTGFAGKFNLSEMTTTRALRQLEYTGLFEIKKRSSKNSNILKCKILKKEDLFWSIEPFLINPVKDVFYVDKEELKSEEKLQAAGDTYLSLWTMIASGNIQCWASYKKKSEYKTATNDLFDSEKQALIQLWKYDPKLTGSSNESDPISVYLSYMDCSDERINKEKKLLIKKAIEDTNADSWN